MARAAAAEGAVTDRLLTARELATELHVSVGALLRWARAGQVPSLRLPSGAIRFRRSAIDIWLDDRERGAAEREESPTRTNRALDPRYAIRLSSVPVTDPAAVPDGENE
jgi:predicted DNA-binding transcriptional regulator AlpA